jgi:serine/threonine-protein kinase
LLGYIQRRQGKWDESLETLEEVFKLNPRSSGLAREIGNNNWHMRRYTEADTWYNRSLSISPRNLNTLGKKGGNSFYWKGNTKVFRATLETCPPGPSTDLAWIRSEMIDGNYDEVLERLNSLSYDTRESQFSYFHKDLAYADVYRRRKEFSKSKTHADLARISLENSVREHPEDPRYRAALGLAYALMGRKDEALEEGNQAIKLLPISKDTYAGPFYFWDFIKILIVIGEHEEVVDKLDYLMSIPAGRVVSVSSLQNDSLYEPLHDNPHFQALVEKYSIIN